MKKKFGLFLPISTAVMALIGCNKQPATYKVTFDLMGGTGVSKTVVEVKEGEKVAKPEETPTKTGYTFNGWYKETSGSEAFDFDNVVIKANTTIYAHYNINKYVVEFDTNGGTKVPEQSIEFGGTIDTSKITTPTKKGYVFKKWQKNGKDFDLGTPIVENTTLTANYEANKHTVKFVLNPEGLEYIDIDPKSISDQTVEYGKYVTRPVDPVDKGTKTQSGDTKYAFAGWFEDKEYTKPYTFETTMGDSDLTLYAKWVNTHYVAAFYYGINPESGEEVWEYQLAKIDGEKKATVNAPTDKKIEGYHIDKWLKDGKRASFPDTITGHTVYDAEWAIDEFTVKFNTDGGTPEIKDQTVQYGGKVSKPRDPTKIGYTFTNWVDENDVVYNFSSPVYRDITLKATWEINKYTVSFDLNFPIEDPKKPVVDPVDPITVPYGSTLGNKLPVLKDASEYFQFGGWYTDKEYKEKFTPFTPVEKDTLLYAKWDRDAYVITLDYGKDPETQEEIIYQETVQKGAQYNPGEPTYKSHDFLGWFNQKEGGEKISTPITINNDLTIYAHWEIKEFNVTFEDSEGGTVSETVRVKYGETVSRPAKDPDPKGDMIFIDWYNYDLKDKFDFENTKIVEDTKIIAQFGYTVTFDTDGLVEGTKIETQKIVKNFCATNPGYPEAADPTKNMYAWLDENNNEYNFNSKITKNIKLHPGFADCELTMLGDNNINIDNSAGYEYKVLADGSIMIPDKDVTFGVLPEYQHIIKYDETNRKFKAVGGLNGGKAVIYAYVLYNSHYYYQTKEVSVGSFSKLKADSLANGIVEANNNSVAGDVVIPTVYYTSGSQAVKITEIKNSAFIDCTNLQRVYIPNTITRIEDDAFRTFDRWSYAANGNLNTVVFEENSTLEYIGVAAFDGQTKLASIKIPASVTTICAGAFYDTIKSVEFEDKDSTWHLVPTSISVTPEVDEYNISQFTPEQIANDLKIPSYDNQSYHADFHWYKNILK